MQGDQALQFVGKMGTPLRQTARERIVFDIQGMRQMIHAGQHRGAEELAIVDHSANRHAAETYSVIALFAADETRALARAASAVIGNRNFQRRIDRLRP